MVRRVAGGKDWEKGVGAGLGGAVKDWEKGVGAGLGGTGDRPGKNVLLGAEIYQ